MFDTPLRCTLVSASNRDNEIHVLEDGPAVGLSASSLPPGFTETQFSGIASPTAIAVANDGRAFVAQQGGQLRVIKNGALLSTPFMTLTVDSTNERGLIGVVLDPNFASNNYLYA